MSIWRKAYKLSLKLTETKWTLFHSRKKKRLIANKYTYIYIDNFEIVRESINKSFCIFIGMEIPYRKLDMEIPYRTCL